MPVRLCIERGARMSVARISASVEKRDGGITSAPPARILSERLNIDGIVVQRENFEWSVSRYAEGLGVRKLFFRQISTIPEYQATSYIIPTNLPAESVYRLGTYKQISEVLDLGRRCANGL